MSIDLRKKKILLTGGAGFLGSFVLKKLLERGIPRDNITIPRSKDCDLRAMENCRRVVTDHDIVIHLAGDAGGIGYNQKNPGQLFYNNLLMGTFIIEAARLAGVKKILTLGSICSYPKMTPVPFSEETLWDGYPEETNAAYGLAKKMMLVQSQAYRQQYGFNAVHLLTVNLYGPRDNYNPASSHVIPALIRKVTEAKREKHDFIEVWGTGNATREFLYAGDAAEGIVLAAERYDKADPVNLGSGNEISIRELVETLTRVMNFTGEIRWTNSTDGQPRRLLGTQKAFQEFGFKANMPFEQGLKATIEWYEENHLDALRPSI
jgi:GDP-L-fucose synthase